ncbi:hypothetical protein [Dongshaea marina]|nr:hypothetical protein [Dongshaea marina]
MGVLTQHSVALPLAAGAILLLISVVMIQGYRSAQSKQLLTGNA